MSKLRTEVLLIVCSGLAAACGHPESSLDSDGLASFNEDSLKQHIITLSSDAFQGRRPFTRGEAITVDYLAKSFTGMGLEPGNGTSYFQDVPLMEITPVGDPVMKVTSAKGNFELKKMEDYVIWTESTSPKVALDKDEVVFAGYGIVAPEYNWNDYAGMNVKGKIVLVMVNDPGYNSGDTTFFKGKTMTYYGRWTYKFEEAARQGAKGCLIIHNTVSASYPFNVVQNSWGKAQMHLDSRGSGEYRCPVEGWVTAGAARKMLQSSPYDTSLLMKAEERGFKAVSLGIKVSAAMNVNAVFNSSHNVIGKITGTKRPDEYIVYTAHWDHFGIGKPDEKGDSIYNGALDNASGTAALLELARAFKSMKEKPERTIIFLAVTAEEQGLLGSEYYAHHPVYPIDKTVANINIDGINSFGRTKDISITGAGQSELEDYFRKEVQRKGRYIATENHPEAGHYFRSDHFSFAKVGVPALTTGSGVDHLEKGKTYGQQQEDEYTAKYYHRPADEYDPSRWNLAGGLEDIELLFQVGKQLAFETTWPKWKEGSEFRKLRK
jgi:Zn-dependent M28 family amino/carboxypeptidase